MPIEKGGSSYRGTQAPPIAPSRAAGGGIGGDGVGNLHGNPGRAGVADGVLSASDFLFDYGDY